MAKFAEDTKASEGDDFALEKDTPSGKLPAYPKMLYFPTGGKYGDGSDICTTQIVKNPEEHKKVLAEKKAPAWNSKPKD